MKRLSLILQMRSNRRFSTSTSSSLDSIKKILSSPRPEISSSGHQVCVTGWFKSIREQKNYSFGELIDGSTASSLQLVWPTATGVLQQHQSQFSHSQGFSTLLPSSSSSSSSSSSLSSSMSTVKPTLGSSVKVWGTLIASPKPMQPVELQVTRFEMLGINDVHNYPLQRKAKESPEFLREILHLRARTPQISAAMRVRDSLSFSIASFMRKKGVLHVHTPVLTSNDCEGAGELFSVSPSTSARTKGDFFGKPVHLTVSGQLHLEALAVGGALSRVYSLGPTFRAEDSNTPRHLCEFWMLEAELAPGSMHDSINLAEDCLRQSCRDLLNELPDDIGLLVDNSNKSGVSIRDRLEECAKEQQTNEKFPHITYTEALKILHSSKVSFKIPIPLWGQGLALEHERFLSDIYIKGPVFITSYPASCKPFYMRSSEVEKSDKGGEETVEAFDFLVPGVGELAGGSAREDRFDLLASKMQSLNLLSTEYSNAILTKSLSKLPHASTDSKFLDWYLDLRRFGGTSHSGFGLGFERLVMFATGIENVRDVIPMPRTPNSCRM